MRFKTKFCQLLVFIIFFVFTVYSCKPTRLLSEDQYLLKSNKIQIDNDEIDKQEMEAYHKQRPNRRVFFMFYHRLSVHNFSKIGKERKWKNWLDKKIGEPPAIYDSSLMYQTNAQFQKFLKNEAYYNAKIDNKVKYSKKKVKVTYNVEVGKPLLIEQVEFQINDSLIAPIINKDSSLTLLKKGKKLSLERLKNEQNRIVKLMKNNGYYEFFPDYVKYFIDTINYKAKVLVDVEYALKLDENDRLQKHRHKQFKVKDIFIFTDYNPKKMLQDKKAYEELFDTVKVNNYHFIYTEKPNVRPSLILKANSIKPFSIYNQESVNQTNNHINSLKLFRLQNVLFKKKETNDTLLDCQIQLTPFTYQNYSFNVETTNVRGNFGFGGYVSYQHKNLLKGAEILSVKLSGSLERQSSSRGRKIRNIFELGAELRLETPAFLLPFKMQRFYKKYYPKTIFSIAYSIRKKPEQYTRNLLSVSAGYQWSKDGRIRNYFYPLEVSAVTLPQITQAFADTIRGSYLEKNYKDYFILGPRYIVTNISAKKNKYKNYSFFRWNIETAGNFTHLLHKNTSFKDTIEGGYYAFFNTQYAQFFKTDVDYRYHNFLNKRNSLVYRFFAGFVVPYGNAQAVPFIRQYSSGGGEGMRAWLARDLGPGTYSIPDSLNLYPDQYGDVKLEMNVEYRFEIIKALKGAYFLDVGNIWTLNKVDEREGGEFKFNQFYKQLAVGTGFGLRLDFNFAVIRLDAGIKVKDPSILQKKYSWVLLNRPFKWEHIVFNFGIGYPF